jgi:hypothetical protein
MPAGGSGPETISALNIASSEGADALWQLLLEAPEETVSSSLNSTSTSAAGSLSTPMKAHAPMNTPSTPLGGVLSLSAPESSVIRAIWSPLAKWKSRALRRKELLHVWEKSVGEATGLRANLDSAQTELKSRNDELRAAKAANSELEQIIRSQEEKLSKVPSEIAASAPAAAAGNTRTTRSRGASSASAASSSSSAASAAASGDASEVDKLKSEVKLLTSALSVLEIQFENAEKENKRLRGAKIAAGAGAGGGDNTASAASVTAVLALAKSWRDIASHRLLNSMQPLPVPPSVIPSLPPHVLESQVSRARSTIITSSSAAGEGAHAPEGVAEKTIVDPKKTYRDIRKLRSTLRINWNSAAAIGPTTTSSKAGMMGLCWAGCEGRKDRVMLLEKFKNSLHVAQGAQIMC